ncbi:shikimate dehydrogenase family protein [Microvirga arabica]|uniref:Shikimate dehydrogenase family protein n=1 Tax=Microvirga arabica TaxID=1128671 RepID=A0ABV6YBJ0_9HYPH
MNFTALRPPRAGSVDFVNGRTRLYGIVGHPIEQVRSPETVTFELQRRDLNAILLPIHIKPEEFSKVFPRILQIGNLDGIVVTVPYKGQALSHIHRAGPMAQLSGGVSVIGRSLDDRWVGEMFDGVGCIAALLRRGVVLTGRRVLLLGAGGAGSAIAAELARCAPGDLFIHDPETQRAADVIGKLSKAFPNSRMHAGLPSLEEIDVLVNASPVGMLDANASPLDVARLPSQLAVMDAIMDPDQTKLLRIAEESGCQTIYGREMLDSQIAAACDFMLDIRPRMAEDVVFQVQQSFQSLTQV